MKDVQQSAEFEEWISELRDRQAVSRILLRIQRLARGNPGDVEPAGEGISEMRLHFGPGYRVYYTENGSEIVVLLCGGDKSTQKKDILEARRIASEWAERPEHGQGKV